MSLNNPVKLLNAEVARKIAAGEVIDRPNAIIRELMDNAIDSGAEKITVEIASGGIEKVRIVDNGCGMTKDDLQTCARPHATSKINSADDLDSIRTLGFRGEALPSISAVAKVELLTRTENEEIGTSYKIFGGEEIELTEAGCPVGTTLIVRDLFFNIPARMKFLKKDVQEGNYIAAILE